MRILFFLFVLITSAQANDLRVAMWYADYSRKGPGLLINEILKEKLDLSATAATIRRLNPDILLLTNVDADDQAWAAELLGREFGFGYASLGPSNRGLPLGIDVNRDNWMDGNDLHGYAEFRGQASMLLLSQSAPIRRASFNELLLKDYSPPPYANNAYYYDEAAWEILRLAPVGLWDHDFGPFHILSTHSQTPAFDDEDEHNQIRNAAELKWWMRYLSGEAFMSDQGHETALESPFILMGTLNLDPQKGKGRRPIIAELLAHPMLNPVETKRRETVDWSRLDLGEMRVDYILPSCHFEILASGQLDLGSEHALLWADLRHGENCNP